MTYTYIPNPNASATRSPFAKTIPSWTKTPRRVEFLGSDEHKALVEECRWVAQVSRAVIGLD